MTRRRQWRRGRNGDLPDWYGANAPFVVRTMGELMREENEADAKFDGSWTSLPSSVAISTDAVPSQGSDKLQSVLAQAEFGDIAPLRALYPGISEYINLPKRKRGVTWSKNRSRKATTLFFGDTAMLAAHTARDIYAQWQRDYGMQNRRRLLGQCTAVDVAVAYLKLFGWEVSVRAVERELWHHGRRRK